VTVPNTHPFYEQPALNVETYDARTDTRPDSPLAGDVEFFIDLALRSGGPALELGAGTGRILWPMAAAGIEVVGLERSAAMIAAAERKAADYESDVRERVHYIQGDMADFKLDTQFGLVFAGGRVFQFLLTPEDQRRCLACVRRHLLPGGLLALDLFDPRFEWLLPDSGAPTTRDEVRHPQSGNVVSTRITRRVVDPLTQVISEDWLFQEMSPSGGVLREEREHLRLRWTHRQEMRHLFELCGFEVVAEYSDFRRSPPRYGAEQIWIARVIA
jgi:SAM-dependent methyltransferase